MWIDKIALFILLIFALLGASFLGIIFHEYSHYNDFKDFNVTDNEICGLVLPMKWTNFSEFVKSPAGFYSYRVYLNNSNNTSNLIYQKYQAVDKNTETKAYFISILVLAFFLLLWWIVSFSIYRDKEKIIEQTYDNIEKDIYITQLEKFILSHVYNKDDGSTS